MARDLLVLALVPRFTLALALGREACCPFCARACVFNCVRASVACVRMDLALGSWELYSWQVLDADVDRDE